MNIKLQLDQEIKQAMLAGQKQRVTTLRGLKSALLYAEVGNGSRQTGGLSDQEVLAVLAKESKKRQESYEQYNQAGEQERAATELAEKEIIDGFLPQQLSDQALAEIVDKVIAQAGATGPVALGQVIGAVKQQTAGQADGARIAALVKEKLSK